MLVVTGTTRMMTSGMLSSLVMQTKSCDTQMMSLVAWSACPCIIPARMCSFMGQATSSIATIIES